jgi:cytochrome c biogenesis protein
MTDVRAPETDPFDPAAERDDPPRPGPRSPGTGAFGISDWLKWAWRQLTSMRIALVLLFLLALGSVPGSILPQEGTDAPGVQQYFTAHPDLAPWLNRLGLFNVFAAPWFAAIYLLLFASLVGCVIPRTFRLAGSARTLPPRAPRYLLRLPRSAEYVTALPPADAAEVAARVLSGRGFRLRRPPAGDGAEEGHWVSAEKGYLREAGNLLFHLALLGVLVSVALGGLFGYKADRLLVQGQTFADTATALDEFHPGRFVTDADLARFTMTLDKFTVSYISSGEQAGQPSSFDARVTYTGQPGTGQTSPPRTSNLDVNKPVSIDGAKVYLIGHGYAPVFKVTDARGQVVYDQATPFIASAGGNFLSEGVVKVQGAQPEQLGFTGVFVPTAVNVNGTLESVFPAADNPVVSLLGYAGNLGMNSGPPQSVYQLDTSGMKRLTANPQLLHPGQSLKLPGGQGTITFTGYVPWISLAITHDPGQLPALICGMAALGGLLLSFMIRRRRVFVRARPGPEGTGTGTTVVQVGGLARTDASGGFEAEFATLAAELRSAHERAVPAAQPVPPQPEGE